MVMKWVSDSSILNGLPADIGYWSKPTVWDDGTLKLITGKTLGSSGYYWDGSTWISDSSLINGLPTTSPNQDQLSPCVFSHNEYGHTLWLAHGTQSTNNIFFYYWSGSAWVYHAGMSSGFTGLGSNVKVYVFTSPIDGKLCAITGASVGGANGFVRDSGTWSSDSAIVNGISVDKMASAETFTDNGILKLIIGYNTTYVKGYYWDTNIWIEDTYIVNNISGLDTYPTPIIWDDSGVFKLIFGNYNGTFDAFYLIDIYEINGTITKSNGNPLVGITIRVTNNTTSEYSDDTTDASGKYSRDSDDFTSGYSNGDSITVRCYSIERNIKINKTLYPSNQTVNLVCFNNFKIDGANINNIISTKVKKTIDNMAWQSESLLENKSGYRSNDFVTGQDLEVEIDGTTLLKGEVSDVDLSKQHLLKIVGYNYTDDLNRRYITSSFTSKSIYYAITDAVDGLIPNFAPGITTTNVANDVNTQQTFTKDFDEDSVSDALSWLGNLASSLGYIYYIDNDKDLHFYERKSVDSGITLTNTGANRSVLSWKWKNYSGDDLYNRIRVIGTGVDVTRNDISSQSFYGIREHPPITDLGITTTAAANEVGDNLLDKFANPGKNVDLKISTNTSAGDIFGLEPGDLVRVTLVGSGISGDNPFPWTFPMFFDPTLKMIQSIEHQFPQFVTTLKLTDYYKDLSTLITSTTK